MYEAYKAMGKDSEALAYHEQMHVLDDSLNEEETTKKLQQMEFTKQVLTDSIATAENERLVDVAHQEEVRKKDQTMIYLAGTGLFTALCSIWGPS